MKTGETVGGRFVVDRVAGRGGSGTVYRATDIATGEPVAVKVLHDGHSHRAERFVTEARALAGLSHPAIVRYVSHGVTEAEEPFLAMEWLDGQDLGERLLCGALTVPETVTLGHRIAGALGEAHDRGIVHRDVKPSNLFLCEGDPGRVKLVDFGVARVRATATTRAGAVLGTPGYMAPEQARGARDLDARADVFSLGCVLFECLAGRPLFLAEHVMAVLAKILLEAAPRLGEVRGDVPAALEDLVARMLAKPPGERPADGHAVLRELEGGGGAHAVGRPETRKAEGLTEGERRLLCVVLASSSAGKPDASPTGTIADEGVTTPLRAVVEAHGAEVEAMLDGSVVATLLGQGDVTDQAVRAARCALAIRAALPHERMALSIGRGELLARWPTGEVIDRAAALVAAADAGGPILLDEVASGLLDARFELVRTPAGPALQDEEERVLGARGLRGKDTPCVGRDRELALLDAVYDEVVSEPVARAAVVLGDAGLGKSRLRSEFIQRLSKRPEKVRLWAASGDPMGAGSPFLLLARLLRNALGIVDGDVESRRAKVILSVFRSVDARDAQRVAEFVGELVAAPFSDDASVQLRDARRDAMVMGDQMQRAWEDFLRAESRAAPVVLVLEDLHWGDVSSVKFVATAMKNLSDSPIFVLALGRPEAEELASQLRLGGGATEVRLGPLTKKACETLAAHTLGAEADPGLVARLVGRAQGNPFYLEELLHAVSTGNVDTLPETVLAMVHARLDRLRPEVRRVLRAVSVFGQSASKAATAALLGVDEGDTSLRQCLAELAAEEQLVRSSRAGYAGMDEYAFTHALIREASYATLTDGDRVLGHRLAGGWLESHGTADAMTLGAHFERGGMKGSAARWYGRAAEQALEGNDHAGAILRANKALGCGADGREAGLLDVVRALAHHWRGEFAHTLTASQAAMAALPPRSAPWYTAAGELAVASFKLGDTAALVALADRLRSDGPLAGEERAFAIAAMRTATYLIYAARADAAQALLAHAEPVAEALGDREPSVRAWTNVARATRAEFEGDPAGYLEATSRAAGAFERAGDLRNACTHRLNVGYANMEMGSLEEAEASLREALSSAERMGLVNLAAIAKHNLGLTLGRNGKATEGARVEVEAILAFDAQSDRKMAGASRAYLAAILAFAGDLERAEHEARLAVTQLPEGPTRPMALATLSRILLGLGRTGEALEVAREAMDTFSALEGVEEGESLVRLAHAEALLAGGHREAARKAVVEAVGRLDVRGRKIRDLARRASFLERIAENAKLMDLAKSYGI